MVQKNNQSGQIALLSLLVLMVATTVGLSLIARSTTDVSVARNVEESSRAFSAAEAGIEEGLKSGESSGGDVIIDPALGVKYSVEVTSVGGNANPFELPWETVKEDTETIWLVNHDPATGLIIETPTYTASTIDVCWSTETIHPAVVVTILYKTGTSYRVAKAAYDPDSRSNNFTTPSAGGCTANTNYHTTITFSDYGIAPASDTLIALRIRPVYSGAQLAVAPLSPQTLPSQGSVVEAAGSAGSNVNRKITAFKQFRAPASIFDYAVYSESSFSQ